MIFLPDFKIDKRDFFFFFEAAEEDNFSRVRLFSFEQILNLTSADVKNFPTYYF